MRIHINTKKLQPGHDSNTNRMKDIYRNMHTTVFLFFVEKSEMLFGNAFYKRVGLRLIELTENYQVNDRHELRTRYGQKTNDGSVEAIYGITKCQSYLHLLVEYWMNMHRLEKH